MASICLSCRLHIRTLAPYSVPHATKRALSSTIRKQVALPNFVESSDSGINNILSILREKHFIPAALSKQERQLIFKKKYKQTLEDNPRTATIAGEKVPLKHLDRRTEIPNRDALVKQAARLIGNGDAQDWQNVPQLLTALHTIIKKTANEYVMTRFLDQARANGQMGIIMQCLQQADKTGMTLNADYTLHQVLAGVREIAQKDEWSQASVEQALRYCNSLARILEREEHGGGQTVSPNDPRTRPEVLGLYLELAAVNAMKYHSGADREALVKTLAERVMSLLGRESFSIKPWGHMRKSGPQWRMILAIPVWHGLVLAQRMLGVHMPRAVDATIVIKDIEATLDSLALQLELRPEEDHHAREALELWKGCKRGMDI